MNKVKFILKISAVAIVAVMMWNCGGSDDSSPNGPDDTTPITPVTPSSSSSLFVEPQSSSSVNNQPVLVSSSSSFEELLSSSSSSLEAQTELSSSSNAAEQKPESSNSQDPEQSSQSNNTDPQSSASSGDDGQVETLPEGMKKFGMADVYEYTYEMNGCPNIGTANPECQNIGLIPAYSEEGVAYQANNELLRDKGIYIGPMPETGKYAHIEGSRFVVANSGVINLCGGAVLLLAGSMDDGFVAKFNEPCQPEQGIE